MARTLKNAGFRVDKDWALQEKHNFQEDVKNYVYHIIGLSEAEPGPFYKFRQKNDMYYLDVIKNTEAKLTYQPNSSNTDAEKGSLQLTSADLLRGVIQTYISEKQCSEELREKLPIALMKELLAAVED